MRIKVQNPYLQPEERTYLTSDYSSGTSLSVRNNNNATANYYVIVGEPGQEQTETKVITGTSGSETITLLSALSFSHPKSTPVYIYQFNKIAFERKPSGGSFSEVSSSPFNIDWDNADKTTLITLSTSAGTDTYRWRFYNSTTGVYSNYSDNLAGTGLDKTKIGYVILQVRKNPATKQVDDETIFQYANDWQTLVYEEIPRAWWFTKKGTAVSTASGDYDYSISTNWSDFLSMEYVLYNYTVGDMDDTYPLTFVTLAEFYNLKADANQSEDDHARCWTLLPPDDSSALGYIGIHPTPDTAVNYVRPVYHFALTDLDSYGDTLVIPDHKGYVNYILYRIFDDIKNDSQKAGIYNSRVGRSILALKKRQRRNLGQKRLFRFQGQRGYSRMFGENIRGDWQNSKETQW